MGVSRKIPLMRLLKGNLLRIAEMQDILILEISREIDFVIHGGTAIWRIYGGKRFSYYVDIYSQEVERIPQVISPLLNIVRVKLTPSGVLYMKVGNGATVELEASPMFEEREVVEEDFWLVDGSTIVVKTLTPCSLLEEKIGAYIGRRKARDLYDIYFLSDLCPEAGEILKKLLRYLDEPPKDFPVLKELIIAGRPPSFETIVRKVRRIAH